MPINERLLIVLVSCFTAVVMVRFARECMNSMRLLTRKLEMTLGPDTSMLAMRMGIHSGTCYHCGTISLDNPSATLAYKNKSHMDC